MAKPLAPTPALGTTSPADPGVYVSFLAGLAGFLCGLAAIGFSFVRKARTKGILQLVCGLLALAALAGAILFEELPLLNSYFRALIVLREGFYLYIVAAAALAVTGIMQSRRWA
jgi:predicted lipid-binding transport protein (Tim44 family)